MAHRYGAMAQYKITRKSLCRMLKRVVQKGCKRPARGEQVPYRYPSKAKPCFSRGLRSDELNRLIHLPTARHKIERHVMAKKCLMNWICLGKTAKAKGSCSQHPVHSCWMGTRHMQEGGYADRVEPFTRPSRNCLARSRTKLTVSPRNVTCPIFRRGRIAC